MTLTVMRKIKKILHVSENGQVKNTIFTNDLLLPHQPYHDVSFKYKCDFCNKH